MKSNSRSKADINGIIKRFSSRYSLQGRRKDGSRLTRARVSAMMSGNARRIKRDENFSRFPRVCAFSPSNAATFLALRLLVVLFPREEYSLRAFFLSVAFYRRLRELGAIK